MHLRKWKLAVWIMLLLTLATTVVFLILLPDIVPAHYNFAGEVDRMGSKYENLLFPAISLFMAGFFLLMARGKGRTDTEKRILYIAAVFTLLLFYVLDVYFMAKALLYDPQAPRNALDTDTFFRLLAVALGLLLTVLSNLMPKARRNTLMGLRTSWSLYNDDVWAKSQRFGARSGVLCGALTMLCALFLSGFACLATATVLVLLWTAACVLASWRYYRAAREREG